MRRSLLVALALSAMGVAVFVLGPTGDLPTAAVQHTSDWLTELGVPAWLSDPSLWAFIYNILLFVPVAFVCATLWRRVAVRMWAALGLLGSLAIEAVQALLLAGRDAQAQDLVANTLGALLGASLARTTWSLLHRGRLR